VELVDLDTLYRRADFITVHVPLSKETRGLIGAAEIQKMKPGVRIVNCARGGIVDEAALAAAIQAGRVAGAALDVFEAEPPWGSPVLDLDAVVVTPHLGASTEEAQTAVALAIAQQVADLLVRGVVRNAVNAPSVDPEVLKELAPYLALAQKLGSFLGQMARGRMAEVHLRCAGEIAAYAVEPLTVTFLRGLLAVILEESVTDVNAPYLARQRGLRVVESRTPVSEDWASLLTAELRTDVRTWQVAGTLYQRRDPRIVEVDGYRMEAHPDGWMLVFSNDDVPGVIGRIGTLFGRHGINIAGMQLGRERPGGQAVSILNLDGAVPDHVLAEIRALPNIRSATLVRL
jgi:D-3-phosphoglycerate dehydrogenase